MTLQLAEHYIFYHSDCLGHFHYFARPICLVQWCWNHVSAEHKKLTVAHRMFFVLFFSFRVWFLYTSSPTVCCDEGNPIHFPLGGVWCYSVGCIVMLHLSSMKGQQVVALSQKQRRITVQLLGLLYLCRKGAVRSDVLFTHATCRH